MRRLLKYIIAGSVAAGTAQAFAGGLPETKANGDSASTSAVSTTSINTSGTTTASIDATSSAGSSGSDGTTATAESDLADASQASQDATTGGVEQGNVEAGAFVAIEDDPLIIDASSVMDGDGVGSISVQWQASSNNKDW